MRERNKIADELLAVLEAAPVLPGCGVADVERFAVDYENWMERRRAVLARAIVSGPVESGQ